jgi:hypothetical protein
MTMADHLTDEVLLDVLEESAVGEDARAHVAGCEACAARIEESRGGAALLGDADVPEPGPAYWATFRRQVARRVESPVLRLARPAFLAPLLAAAAAVAVALWGSLADRAPSPPAAAPVLPAWSALPPADEDEALAVLVAVVPSAGEVDLGHSCRDAACLVGELTDEESAALADALRREIPAAGKS